MATLNEFFFLPFDHRSSFEKDLFGVENREPTASERVQISHFKKIIYAGFMQAVAKSKLKETAGILVDEEFGAEIIIDAKINGYWTACPVEKSGVDELEFEYGEDYKSHLLKLRPDFAKVLVRYNPESPQETNQRQLSKLKKLSDFCVESNMMLMIELLVPATFAQAVQVEGDTGLFDEDLRPQLMVEAIRKMQDEKISPDLWKVEGMDSADDYRRVVNQIQSYSRKKAKMIVLGRGENKEKITQWLSIAAANPDVAGFAIGRTIWEDSLLKLKKQEITVDEAVSEIAQRFKFFCDLWKSVKKKQYLGLHELPA
jgi:myo-inositol catabolism protein IolC